MSGCEWEERVALYAGGDLAAAEVERHLAGCESCQLLLGGVRESLAVVQAAHREPIDPAHFSAVRARVLAEIERGQARRWRFAWTYAMAAAAVVLAVVLWPRAELRLTLPMPLAPAAPVVARVELPRPKLRPRVETAGKTETVTMRIETDNPDVVIYWITDSKGDTK